MSTALIAAGASIFVAALTFLLTQRGLVLQERRHARLIRISSQLAELYAPLRVLVDVNEHVWESLRASGLPPRAERRPDGPADWRRWRDHVLMPANRAMRDLILEHADLLVEAPAPDPLGEFCAHVAALEVALAAEATGTIVPPLVRHPGDPFVSHVRNTFAQLTSERQRLLTTRLHRPARLDALRRFRYRA
ncbi:hypothetical protein [Nocardia sp. BMG111209]|uniref:hypothetical protein n=1 Tax=Nocardia sp. BMG111209 TaxID=1160137 RepID=UPI0003802B1D|nr:hypothetical protein [Nocardia sp. BMG111209]